jgi:hypothetical protein
MDLSIAISAGALVSAALSADMGPGLWLGAGLRGGPLSVDLELRGMLPAKAFARDPSDPKNPKTLAQQFDLSEWAVNLVPCARFKYVMACGVVQAGLLVASGSSQPVQLDHQLAAGPRLGIELSLFPRFAIFGFGEALVTLDQRAFTFTIENAKWAESQATVFFGAGVAFDL